MEILNELSSLKKKTHKKASSIDRFMSSLKSIFTFNKKITPTQSLVNSPMFISSMFNSQSSANCSNKVSVKSVSLGSQFIKPSLSRVFSKRESRFKRLPRRSVSPLPGPQKRIQYLKMICQNDSLFDKTYAFSLLDSKKRRFFEKKDIFQYLHSNGVALEEAVVSSMNPYLDIVEYISCVYL